MAEPLEVYTLGNFKIRQGSETITENIQKISKRWKLLQYLIVHANREVSRDELIMVLQLNNNDDPEGALTALVYRLRKLLNNSDTADDYIRTLGSAYSFNKETEYWFDAEEFANICANTCKLITQDSEEAVGAFNQALKLYKGDFLQEAKSEEWVWSKRNHYRDILVDTMIKMDEFLRDRGEFEKALEFYDRLNEFVFFDEMIIRGLIQTMVDAGKYSQAKKKYDEIIKLYEDNGLKIPPELEGMAGNLTANREASLQEILDKLNKGNKKGLAYLTDSDNFIKLYELEKRRAERTGISRMVVHIKLVIEDGFEDTEKLEDKMLDLLIRHLRSGDIVCRWEERHFIIILLDIGQEKVNIVTERIENAFIARYGMPEGVSLEERSFQL
ncbi:MAG: BTAD domain-containing putative transcriptional regulator [Bacillota bacterium]